MQGGKGTPQLPVSALASTIRFSKTMLENLARGNAVGRVDLDSKHARIGYVSHPAVVDSCMHLGVFVGSPDGHTRVPGESILKSKNAHSNLMRSWLEIQRLCIRSIGHVLCDLSL